MKKIFGATVALAILAIFISSAQAINISSASVQSGIAVVHGGKAAANATITWEGGIVAKANKNGGFSFSGAVPSDCVGTLSDGVSTIDVALTNCTPASTNGGVLQTGQTTCYDSAGNVIACAGTGQDGEFRKGTARSYTSNANGTITDNVTGLVWEKLTNDGTIHDVNNYYTLAAAYQKIADLNTANFAGNNDWRLPNIDELLTLVDYGRFYPAIDPVFNNGVDSFTEYQHSTIYWSSTTYAFGPPAVWTVYFSIGFVNPIGPNQVYVRAVRGGS